MSERRADLANFKGEISPPINLCVPTFYELFAAFTEMWIFADLRRVCSAPLTLFQILPVKMNHTTASSILYDNIGRVFKDGK